MTNDILVYCILVPLLLPILIGGFLYLFDYISDSDVWVRKEDRDK
jgi:hypothetical protein